MLTWTSSPQINYLEDNDINAFEIQVNARSVAKCIAMEASDLEEKINTCHTGAVTYLGPGESPARTPPQPPLPLLPSSYRQLPPAAASGILVRATEAITRPAANR